MIKPTVQTTFTDTLSTLAEQHAEAAEQLVPFSGFKLLHVKRQLSIMLSLIGREKLFDQYTRHDITHINELLEMVNWVVPQSTRGDMTPVDWLLVVLAIYFHDFGMLVTPLEYAKRYESGFAKFRDESLLGGDSGKDYAAKVAELPVEDAERFLYQEFVRFTHAARVRAWVMGEAPKSLGITNQIMEELAGLLDVLPEAFRRDLGTVCESHHLDDLADLKKYRVSQPYGSASSATANVQYAAIVLRTVDLLHMTSDRTPSVAFKLISPTDPISQREWAKQLAVRAVRPRPARNKDGEVDDSIQPDSIEVHALFRNAEGFFALTTFLRYVQGQLRKSHEWVKASHREGAANYKFPWRDILDDQVEAQGFINKNFEFTLDQTRILDLLTGHTLYNDTSIVLRELVQNGIDAVRAQRLTERTSGSLGTGAVTIRWNTKTRVLDVQDDGTGMTQDIIEAHLLKVGSSRYQDAEFKKKYPDFAPISRFGIGILSSFMVGDSVDIFTAHPDEPENRHLSIRTVHGKYLIKLISKDNDVSTSLGPHGTLVRLEIRHTAKLPNVLDTIRRWIVVPNCNVEVIIDGAAAVQVGFASPKDALVAQLKADRLLDDNAEPNPKKPGIRVEQVERDGITLAYALQWSDYFKEWSFLETSREETMLGTCIEGIRVEFVTPGFNEGVFYAIANARGRSAPRTNVARSGLEKSPEFMKALATIYSLYCDHVRAELVALRQDRNFSLTWAAREARYLLASLIDLSERGILCIGQSMREL